MTIYDIYFFTTLITIIITRILVYGIFLDKIGFILIKGKTHKDNYSTRSFIILIIFIILLYMLKKNIFDLYI